MKPPLAPGLWKPMAVLGALSVAAILAVTPGLGFSTGITKENAGVAEFDQFGCTACHGEGKVFRPVDNSAVRVQIRDATGGFLNGPYKADAKYTITITLTESVAPDGGSTGNHAGFNLRAGAGKLEGVDGSSKASSDGKQATHVNAKSTSWNVTWTAPASGAVAFQLFVNDVDGSGSPDKPDTPLEVFFGLTDSAGAVLGAAAVAEHKEFGISLQQYWIGLFGLAGMIVIMVAGFVYLKFVNPHNTDQKDR